jgi:cation diffusion facilitator CzcD-associated flavoprotein CzcO
MSEPIEPIEHLDVVVVGAGLSGIGAAHHLHHSCPWADFTVLESRGAIGGTWDLFRYPGIRSDSDMFTFSYPFRPWNRAESIGEGATIREYIEDTAREDGTVERIRFHHRVVRAEWTTAAARWLLTVERTDPDTGAVDTFQLSCAFLFCCTGYYRYDRGYQPDFAGMADYQGTLIHPQFWPEDFDATDKNIVVIGSGATAITLVPALARSAAHVTMLQRSPTYVVSLPTVNPLTRLIRRLVPASRQGSVLKWLNAMTSQGSYRLSRLRPDLMRKLLRKGVERELPPGYDIDTHFTPKYDPWDQRLCVVTNGDLFAGIREGRVSVLTDRVDHFTRSGLQLESGTAVNADVVVTATGLDLLFLGGMELVVDGVVVDPAERLAYKALMIEGVPNLAMTVGYINASWTLKADLTCEYVCRILQQMRDTGTDVAVAELDDPGMPRQALLALTSGYVTRTADRFPKQGNRAPWQMYNSYLRDFRSTRRAQVDDGVLQFRRSGSGTRTNNAAVEVMS